MFWSGLVIWFGSLKRETAEQTESDEQRRRLHWEVVKKTISALLHSCDGGITVDFWIIKVIWTKSKRTATFFRETVPQMYLYIPPSNYQTFHILNELTRVIYTHSDN